MESTESRFLYDALSITSKVHSKEAIIDLLGIFDVTWETVYGSKGYKNRMYFDGISIHYDSDNPEQSVWLEMSGQGCRTFESFGTGDFQSLFDFVIDNPDTVSITRLDVAFDDRITELIPLRKMWDALADGNYVSSMRKWSREDNSDGGITLYLGSKKSDMFYRIYDKAVERGFTDEEVGHWVRLELQLRDEHAAGWIHDDRPIEEKLIGALATQWRFVDEVDDSNKRRWPLSEWWAKLIDGASEVHLYDTPGVDYNIHKLSRYVVDMAGQAALCYISIVGDDVFKHLIEENRWKMQKNPKYRMVLEEWNGK